MAQNEENMEERVVNLYKKALDSTEGDQKLSLEDRKDILLSFIEFMNNNGSDIGQYANLFSFSLFLFLIFFHFRLRRLTKEYREMAKATPSRKRSLETENEEDTNKPAKVQRTGESSTPTSSSQQPTTTMAPTSPSSYYGQYAMPSVRYTLFCFVSDSLLKQNPHSLNMYFCM
jgi:hypothetical protein